MTWKLFNNSIRNKKESGMYTECCRNSGPLLHAKIHHASCKLSIIQREKFRTMAFLRVELPPFLFFCNQFIHCFCFSEVGVCWVDVEMMWCKQRRKPTVCCINLKIKIIMNNILAYISLDPSIVRCQDIMPEIRWKNGTGSGGRPLLRVIKYIQLQRA